jgi:hypothetical protein
VSGAAESAAPSGGPKPAGTGEGRPAPRAAAETTNPDAGDAPGDVPDAEALVRLLGGDFAAGGTMNLQSAEEFLRNLLRADGQEAGG